MQCQLKLLPVIIKVFGNEKYVQNVESLGKVSHEGEILFLTWDQ